MSITMPSWSFDAIWTQVLGILQNEVIAGLVLASIAVSLGYRLIVFVTDVNKH